MTEIPVMASLATEVFDLSPYIDGDRIMQPKYDGHRILIDYRGRLPKVLNRNGKVYSARSFVPVIPDEFMGMVLDGEYMWQDRGNEHVQVFDLLKDDDDLDVRYDRPWHLRITRLNQILWRLGNSAWRYVPGLVPDTDNLNLCRSRSNAGENIDGIVLKAVDGIYVPGRGEWVKYKFTSDIDCVVSALRIDDKSNCELSVQDSMGNTFPIGKASTAGKRVQVNSVVTVRFLKLTEGMRLREPRIVDVRDDKAPRDCGVEQLIPFVPDLAEQLEQS